MIIDMTIDARLLTVDMETPAFAVQVSSTSIPIMKVNPANMASGIHSS